MDKLLFNVCLSTATAVVTSSSLVHAHQPFVINTIVDMAFDLHKQVERRLEAEEAAAWEAADAERRERLEAQKAEEPVVAAEGDSAAAVEGEEHS